MSSLSAAIVREPIATARLIESVEREARNRGEGCGAVASFVGVVRATHQGRRVRYLEYEAFEPLALRAFERIADECATEWPSSLVAIHHRIGPLTVGDASVVIVAASAHRAEAFQVCRYAIERVKQVAPIWKHEYFEDGDAWVEGVVADPDDEVARELAYRIACA